MPGVGVQASRQAPFHATTNGTVDRGYESILPGDTAGDATGQSKDTVMATRADVGTGVPRCSRGGRRPSVRLANSPDLCSACSTPA
jgi:hypothetical protein